MHIHSMLHPQIAIRSAVRIVSPEPVHIQSARWNAVHTNTQKMIVVGNLFAFYRVRVWWVGMVDLQNMLLVVFVERPAHLHQIPSSRVDLHLEHILSFVRKHQPLKVNEIEIEIVSSCVRVCFESTSENDMFTRVDHHMNDANHCAI